MTTRMLTGGTYDGNPDRLSLGLMIGCPDPRVPGARDADELPTAALARIRRPQWYERAHALAHASRVA